MGLKATLSVVAPTEFRNYPGTNPTPSVEFELWNEWRLLDLALQKLPKPLNYAIRGNMPTLDEIDADWDAYDSFTSPDCEIRFGLFGEEHLNQA